MSEFLKIYPISLPSLINHARGLPGLWALAMLFVYYLLNSLGLSLYSLRSHVVFF
jgi:hypothetical protein